jgi:DNA polymerase-4
MEGALSDAARKIIRVDMDAFYASVEQRDRPHLRGKPVAVGGSPEGRGVVATASYEARRFGVRSAMSAARALRLCPELVLLPPDFPRYRSVSRQFMVILEDYADALEPLALDEAYLDVSSDPAGLGTAAVTARHIRQRVRDELGLTCSAGVSSLKFVAKIASGFRKPDGLTVVPPERVLDFVHPLPIEQLWGVGPASARRLREQGLTTIGSLASLGEGEVLTRLGRHGLAWWHMAHGVDPRGIGGRGPRKSRSAEHTFADDLVDVDAMDAQLDHMLGRLLDAMDQADERARTVTVKVRYADFETVTRSHSFPAPTRSREEVRPVVHTLLRASDAVIRPVRLLGLGFTAFERLDEGPQLQLPLRQSGKL